MDRHYSQPDEELTRQLTEALTAGSEALFQHLINPNPDVVAACLKNRRLSDDHLLALLKRRDLTEELIERIYRRCSESLSHKLVLALVKNPATPGPIVRKMLPQLHLFELVDVCFMPGSTPDQRLAAERTIIQRLPTTPLGNKMTLARRATTNVVAELLKEGQPALLEVCLNSPRLQEAAIFQFLNGPQASAETISLIARHSRWCQRPNLRMAILKNSRTPALWFTLWLPKIPLPVIRQLRFSQRTNPKQKRLISEELLRRGANR